MLISQQLNFLITTKYLDEGDEWVVIKNRLGNKSNQEKRRNKGGGSVSRGAAPFPVKMRNKSGFPE